ncbi:hypothetical protein [Spartinivicinus poritis]|uniref:Lipoprotein n=1 Tax=Spartinivicinus poritis TaxID=2994640 RepID=A0ABT5UHV7_9GAMM|nr:hypothetical protein [Spartinivicinus sp. A2-2]MDE1464624.1 hypothetical protein [Spartinivicinus sp. A2-2]
MKYIISIVFTLFLSGCASNLYVYESEKVQSPAIEKIKVFITNPEIGKPYDILVGSGIYEITNDRENSNKLTLKPSSRNAMCGNPLIASFVTFGLVPVSLPSFIEFTYTIETQSSRAEYRHNIELYTRVSIWEWLLKPTAKNETEVMSEALAKSQRMITKPGKSRNWVW